MGKLKISPNLFLEVAEINRFRKFIEDDGYKVFLKYLIKSGGIAQDRDNTFFRVSQKPNSSNEITINPGIAFDNDLNIISLKEAVDFPITNSGIKQWVILSHSVTSDEEGTVSVSNQGVLSGNNTKFTEVLRGQPNFPTRVKFNSSHNISEYEVVEVNSDTEALLSGDFQAESGLKYQVIGTFTPGFQPDDEDRLIYEYDACSIEIREAEDRPTIEDGQFILASVDFSSGTMVISDERSSHIFNQETPSYDNINGISVNPFVALRSVKLKSNFLDANFEWGYSVQSYEMSNTSSGNVFSIVSGDSKYSPEKNGVIIDNVFAGWRLVNRKNMRWAMIDKNEGNQLYLSIFDSRLITGSGDDFVIVPAYGELEVRARLSGTNYDSDTADYVFKFSSENANGHFLLPIEYLDTTVSLRYRMKNSSETTAFQNFATTAFKNINNVDEILGASDFKINIEEPSEILRNYS